MLTIEKHLLNLSQHEPQFELLYSIWSLNKKLIPNAQTAISFNFPHYSLHEKSHSETIIKNIESFLGDERICLLSPTDCWLILMAAYTHDLGMVVFNKVLEKKWSEAEFQEYLIGLSEQVYDKDLEEASKLLLGINNGSEISSIEKTSLPLEIRKAVVLITADYFRRNHHLRSKHIIAGTDEEFSRLINGFNLNGIPSRFATVLAEIAYGHGISFYSVLDRLELVADGIGNDKMHPRFIACLLRLGDLLDVDDKRFNVFATKVLANELPHSSKLHEEKHAAIRHLLISPKAIEVTVDCQTDEVYRIAREWFDWLQKEVENQGREWSNIAPSNLTGRPPSISRGKIKVLYASAEPKDELMNLRFSISNQKVFEIFEGAAIYDSPFVFLREIVQNAIDSAKIQLWREIASGHHNYSLKKHLSLDIGAAQDEIVAAIKFPSHLPNEIWEAFQIDLNFSWKNDDTMLIELKDSGTGISEADLIRMTQHVGESRSKDQDFQKLKKQMPFWLKPTGAFGIGLQSIFLVTNTFTVQTKTDSENSKEVVFYSAKRNEYSRLTKNQPLMNRGTKITIEIPKDKVDEIFSGTIDVHLIESYDMFTDKHKSVYAYKMLDYIYKEFQYITLLNVNFFGDSVIKSEFKDFKRVDGEIHHEFSIEENNSLTILETPLNATLPTAFLNYESFSVGSRVDIIFRPFFTAPNLYRNPSAVGESKYLVRDIPIQEERFPSFFKTTYCDVAWNLLSPESDKILNISRDKFVKKTERIFEAKFLNEILPTCLKKIVLLYERQYKNDVAIESRAIEYFHLELTAMMTGIAVNHLPELYQNYELPQFLATDLNLASILLANFFTKKKVLTINVTYFNNAEENKETIQDIFSQLNQEHSFDSEIVIWQKEYFGAFMRVSGYTPTHELSYCTDKYVVVINIHNVGANELSTVEVNDLAEKLNLRRLTLMSMHGKRRGHMLPLTKYAPYLAVKKSHDWAYRELLFSNHIIISPFRNLEEIIQLKDKFKTQIESKDRQNIEVQLSATYITEFVPSSLVDWISEHSSSTNVNIKKESILNAYTQLILDVLLVSFEDNPILNAYLKGQDVNRYLRG